MLHAHHDDAWGLNSFMKSHYVNFTINRKKQTNFILSTIEIIKEFFSKVAVECDFRKYLVKLSMRANASVRKH